MKLNKILCVIDPNQYAETAIRQSINLANAHQSELTFVSVMNTAKYSAINNEKKQALISYKRSQILEKIALVAPELSANIVIADGVNFIEVIKLVLQQNYDLVVKCAEDKDWLSSIFGSEDMHLLRKCPCPVLMLKPQQIQPFKNVLVTADINDDFEPVLGDNVQSSLNKKVLASCVDLCLPELSTLHVGCAWSAYAEDFYQSGVFSDYSDESIHDYVQDTQQKCMDSLEGLVSDVKNQVGEDAIKCLDLRKHLVKGDAVSVIPSLAKQLNADLVLMGTVGRVGIPGLFIGNTAESILEQVNCSVLAIKPDGFETPVK